MEKPLEPCPKFDKGHPLELEPTKSKGKQMMFRKAWTHLHGKPNMQTQFDWVFESSSCHDKFWDLQHEKGQDIMTCNWTELGVKNRVAVIEKSAVVKPKPKSPRLLSLRNIWDKHSFYEC